MNPGTHTSPTLLARLGGVSTDAPAWAQFVRLYGARIHAWCRHWGLQPADADDVCQDVLLRVARKMCDFKYEKGKSFRSWLKTIARGVLADWRKAGHKPGRGSGDSGVQDALHSAEAREDLLARIEAEFDRELLEVATRRVQLRVDPPTWEAFHLMAVAGLSGAEAAARTGLKVASVFVAKSRVQKMLQEEIRTLEQDE